MTTKQRTATEIKAEAQALLASGSTELLIETYVKAYSVVAEAETVAEVEAAHLAAARVRGWVEKELQRRGELDRRAVALGVCGRCWAEECECSL
jgi:hypothetical protein